MSTVYNRIRDNERKTVLFSVIFMGFFALAVYLLDILVLKNHIVAGIIVFILGGVSFYNYFYSDKFILSRNKAIFLDPEQNENIYNSVNNLAVIAGVPMPKIYFTPDRAINAFTVGRNHRKASLVFTDGALKRLNEAELEGVIAHELAHIQNYDILLSTTIAFFLGLIRSIIEFVKLVFRIMLSFIEAQEPLVRLVILALLYGFFILAFFTILFLLCIPVVEEIIFYKISRKREFLADSEGVLFTRYPGGLVGALGKIAADSEPLETINASTAHLYIASPYKDGLRHFWSGLFHSHPPIQERIKILKNIDNYGVLTDADRISNN